MVPRLAAVSATSNDDVQPFGATQERIDMTSAAANDANWAGAESSAGAPLWEEVEPLLRKTDWRAIVELLDNHETLTPRLRLIHAIARKEIDDERPGADQLAIDG